MYEYFTIVLFNKDLGLGGSLNYRQFTCHPEKGILVAPTYGRLSYGRSTYVFENFENPTPLDNLSPSGSAHIFAVPGAKVEKYDRKCTDAQIEIFNGNEIECLCNDGFEASGTGTDVKCSKNEKWDILQRHCPINKFQCRNDLCISQGTRLICDSFEMTHKVL